MLPVIFHQMLKVAAACIAEIFLLFIYVLYQCFLFQWHCRSGYRQVLSQGKKKFSSHMQVRWLQANLLFDGNKSSSSRMLKVYIFCIQGLLFVVFCKKNLKQGKKWKGSGLGRFLVCVTCKLYVQIQNLLIQCSALGKYIQGFRNSWFKSTCHCLDLQLASRQLRAVQTREQMKCSVFHKLWEPAAGHIQTVIDPLSPQCPFQCPPTNYDGGVSLKSKASPKSSCVPSYIHMYGTDTPVLRDRVTARCCFLSAVGFTQSFVPGAKMLKVK